MWVRDWVSKEEPQPQPNIPTNKQHEQKKENRKYCILNMKK